MSIITNQSQFFPRCQRLWSALFKYNSCFFLTEHELSSDYQLGFQKKRSTETAIVYLTNYILKHMDRQMITGAVFIDLKKAFDLVDHEYLLFKLEHYGVRGSSLDWFQNYLTKRAQRVQFGNDKSSIQAIHFGVPQG